MIELLLNLCPLTRDLPPYQRASIVQMGRVIDAHAGDLIIHQGDAGTTLYIILSGRAEVLRGQQVLATLGAGQTFGEMSLFNAERRTGDVRVVEDSQLLELPSAELMRRALNQQPAALRLLANLGRLMVERLQSQDAEVFDRALAEHPELPLDDLATLRHRLMRDWSLKYHAIGRPGKLAIEPTKPSVTAADLSVAYSPGVAEPCLAIQRDPDKAYEYTARGQLVGVITNGTAVLGLGNIGAAAAKPVMEGKAVLFKKFADIDAFDIELNAPDPDKLIEHIVALEPTFGGINLEDIKAPECFYIEDACKRLLNIPVFHDDQHGTAIIAGAGLLNALQLNHKKVEDIRVVFSGAGAAGVATARFFIALGVRPQHVIMTDTRGVYHTGRADKPSLQDLAAATDARTLQDALIGADAFVGVSVGGLLTPDMLRSMAPAPIVFALANPTPEITPEAACAARPDVIIATGRSDYPNQINNVIAFPYIFRAALDTRARQINEPMKRAAALAIAALTHEPPPAHIHSLPSTLSFGPDYLIPKPFDPRLLPRVSLAVAQAALDSGVARRPLDLDAYAAQLNDLANRRA
jgi:malate dehydrogenase (oxaloacetate-decarboxylating)(NADP+)